MRLTSFSDLSIRVLLLAATRTDRLTTIDETAELLNVSRAHLMKIVNALTQNGFLVAIRGRSGGYRLGLEPEDINLGDVIASTEPDFAIVECMRPENGCILTEVCKLPRPLFEAIDAFLGVLSQYTLADIALKKKDLKKIGLETT